MSDSPYKEGTPWWQQAHWAHLIERIGDDTRVIAVNTVIPAPWVKAMREVDWNGMVFCTMNLGAAVDLAKEIDVAGLILDNNIGSSNHEWWLDNMQSALTARGQGIRPRYISGWPTPTGSKPMSAEVYRGELRDFLSRL